jgi:putative solute:sodium symporter small subunit
MKLNLTQQAYWRKNLRAIGLLLTLWFLLSFVLIFFAREMSFSFFGWPFSFWVAGQGAPLVYCVIVAVYARYMSRLDRELDMAEGQE